VAAGVLLMLKLKPDAPETQAAEPQSAPASLGGAVAHGR
jgi:hypothetical protein